jgi:hypothetical protein
MPRTNRIARSAAIGFVALNIWTGAPLAAVWIGSRMQTAAAPTMASMAVVVVVLFALVIGLVVLLTHLSAEPAGAAPRRRSPWMRSLRDERDSVSAAQRTLTDAERVLTGTVVLAAVTFETWFFFFSSSPI